LHRRAATRQFVGAAQI
ncbi:hypothetical protein EAI_08033, partial [Harpegnathos saltator]